MRGGEKRSAWMHEEKGGGEVTRTPRKEPEPFFDSEKGA